MTPIRWGILGPGTIAHNFADGMAEATAGQIVAIASRSAERRDSFGARYAIADDLRFSTYAGLLASTQVDAIYISTPHPFHAEQAVAAMRAGKHVLVEKPAALCAAEVQMLVEVAAQCNVFFMEAYMYRLHPQIARLLEIIASGEIGQVTHITAQFGFNAPYDPASRLYDPALAGGAILDVGGYPVSLARLVAGAALGRDYADPLSLKGLGVMAASGVDQLARAVLLFDLGITANVAVAIAQEMDNSAVITGTKGAVRLLDPWTPGRNAGPSDAALVVQVGDESRTEFLEHPEHLFTFEAQAASVAIASGETTPPFPSVGHGDSIGIALNLEDWRHQVGYRLAHETTMANRAIAGVLPPDAPRIHGVKVDGLDRRVSQLIMGCDNRDTLAQGAVVWDAFLEAGGTCFDTAFVYGGGLHEQFLGDWIKARGVQRDVVVIAKGGHSPYCTPRALETQLDMSLERLGLGHAPIYIMHRDNPDVPVAEFVDALNQMRQAGKIGVFGGSNWTPARIAQANEYAKANGLEPFRFLNNNLSLAVMEREIWPGCITSNTPEMLQFLRKQSFAHISWSSQARGYFLPQELRDRLPADVGPEHCFGSDANQERRNRAEKLARDMGVTMHNIATAWVLAQSFPSFAVIGPRSPGELATTLPALGVNLTERQVAWLNLED